MTELEPHKVDSLAMNHPVHMAYVSGVREVRAMTSKLGTHELWKSVADNSVPIQLWRATQFHTIGKRHNPNADLK